MVHCPQAPRAPVLGVRLLQAGCFLLLAGQRAGSLSSGIPSDPAFLTSSPQVGSCLLPCPFLLSLPGHLLVWSRALILMAQNPEFESEAPFTVPGSFLLERAPMGVSPASEGHCSPGPHRNSPFFSETPSWPEKTVRTPLERVWSSWHGAVNLLHTFSVSSLPCVTFAKFYSYISQEMTLFKELLTIS